MSICLLLLSLLTAKECRLVVVDYWVPLFVCLGFFGGLVILFVYISIISQNEPLSLNLVRVLVLLPLVVGLNNTTAAKQMRPRPATSGSVRALFYPEHLTLTLIIFTYLIIILFVVLKMLYKYKGALRAGA